MTGYSIPGLGGRMMNYDVSGKYIGCTHTGTAGIKHTFDADGRHTGAYRKIGNDLWEKL